MFRLIAAVGISCVLSACTPMMSGQATSYSGGIQTRALISGPVQENRLVVLAGNTNPKATEKNDRGAVSSSLSLDHMQLVLQRPADSEAALQSLMKEQQDKTSPQYHKWLTAAEFGEKFGVAPADVTTVTNWLTAHNFRVDSIAPSGMLIEFSGSAGDVKQAFHTEIHNLEVNGVKHISNMTDPQIPAALGSVVKGVHSLNDFKPHSMNKKRTKYTFGDGQGGNYEAVVPADLATIYNLNPAFAAGFTGTGQQVVVIEDTDVYSAADITTFRSTFGLSSYSGTFSQVHPTGSNLCLDPGVVSGDEGEAELDAEWAGASAPNASIVLASCGNTLTTFGGLVALQNLVNSSSVPKIVSISYGECEAENGATANASYNNTYQQAAAEGVSVFVSSGDEGAASCDADEANATHGIAVSGFASTPYNVAVGGTDFQDTSLGTNASYWSSTNTAAFGSALSYIPEIPWNDSCANTTLSQYLGYATPYGSSGFCNSSLGEEYYLTTGSGSGGPSGCYSGAPTTSDVVSGTCQGQPKPSWQSVLGNPADNVRDIPDVSLFAANGLWGHYFVYCDSDTNDEEACSGAPSTWSGAGGTSFSSPILAGVQALINQASQATTGSGNPNPRYYSLGALEMGATGSPACVSNNTNGVASTCVFYDVAQGDMDVNCTGSNNCYLPSGTYGVLSTSSSSYSPAYGAQAGWDFATGLGTINAYNLIRDWILVQTTTSITANPNPSNVQQTVTYVATVTPDIGSQPTGTVTWSSNTGCPANTVNTNSTATCTVTWPTAGSQTVTASYSGDGNFANSAGSVTQVVNASPVATISTSALNFPATAAGSTSTLTFTITNSGTGTLSVSAIGNSGAQPGVFTHTSNCGGNPLAAGKSCTVQVTFAPTSAGAFTANLNITDNASGSPQTVTMSGNGQGPAASLSATTLSYGSVAVGTISASQVLTVTNTGTSALTITSVVVGGANPSSYTFVNGCGSTLAAGANCTVHGHFNPMTVGSLPATITITDNAANSPQTVALSGTGSGPVASLSATSLAFGSVPTGTISASQVLTLTNTGTAPLTIKSVVVGGANPSSYTFVNACGATLAAGANCTVHGHFNPTTNGSLPASITITDNAPGSPQTVALSGTGVAPVASLSATSLSYGSVPVGTLSASQVITLTNTGSATLSIKSVVVGGANASSYTFVNGCGATLAAGANCTIHGHFNPTTTGSLPAMITITDNAAGSPQTVTLSGTGS